MNGSPFLRVDLEKLNSFKKVLVPAEEVKQLKFKRWPRRWPSIIDEAGPDCIFVIASFAIQHDFVDTLTVLFMHYDPDILSTCGALQN